MATYTIYKGIENLSKKQINAAAAADKKQVRETLSNFALSLESAYKQLTATGSTSRNAANACKGVYKTAVQVVANCYPYQTAAGELCTKSKGVYKLRTLRGTAAAYSVVKTAVQRFIDYKAGRVSQLVEVVEVVAE